jgi:hypothetical protein
MKPNRKIRPTRTKTELAETPGGQTKMTAIAIIAVIGLTLNSLVDAGLILLLIRRPRRRT